MANLIKLLTDGNIFWRLRRKRRNLSDQKSVELQGMFEKMVEYTPSRINGRLSHPPLFKFQSRLKQYNEQYWDVEHYFLLLNQYKEELR